MSALDAAIKAVVKCRLCGAGYGKCECWATCDRCGWMYERAKGPGDCGNPVHGGEPREMRTVAWKGRGKP
jgi:hypothetical protein